MQNGEYMRGTSSDQPTTSAECQPCPITRVFSRRYRTDDLGFLDLDRSPELYEAAHLFEQPGALVVAPPWLGKTHVARQLNVWLQSQPGDLRFGRMICLTELGVHGAERNLPPVWWEGWRLDTSPPRACWIIDGLDEGEDYLHGVIKRILNSVEGLSESHRAALKIMVFSRQRDWLGQFWTSLGSSYQLGLLQGLPEFQLAPLDRRSAMECVGRAEVFDRVCDLIRRFNLQSVAGYPVALEFLRRHIRTENLTVVDVWRGILTHFLEDPDVARRRSLRSEADQRFAAACRIAAVLAFTGKDQAVDTTLALNLPNLADIFPADTQPLRVAAREAFEVGPFVNSPEGGYRFVQRNVQDWLAAFGLKELKVVGLRSGLCNEQGQVYPRHRDLLPLLRQVTTDPDVCAWIDDFGGGLPFPSDLVLSLGESLDYIDRLERVVEVGPARMWSGEDLARLTASGLGRELFSRLCDPRRTHAVKDLLLDIARATDPEPVVPLAVDMVLDAQNSAALRRRALLLVCQHGGNAELQRLADPIARAPEATGQSREEQQLRATLIRQLVDRRLWTIAEAAVHAPALEHGVIDDRYVLMSRIQERMTAQDARLLLRDRHRIPETLHRMVDGLYRHDLLHVCIDKLLEQDRLHVDDQDMLAEVALELPHQGSGVGVALRVGERLSSVASIRRRFYEHGVTTRAEGSPLAWSIALALEDREWLLEKAKTDWQDVVQVWQDLYRLFRPSHENGQLSPASWGEICRLVERYAPDVPERFERNRQAAEHLRQLHEQHMEELQRERPPTSLREQVTRVLDRADASPEARMRELSCLCFVPSMRPGHITGTWAELDAGLQSQVKAAIRHGLEEGMPSTIPEEGWATLDVICEARAFLNVLEDPEQSSWLTAERVQRWLPAAVFALPEQVPLLMRRCGSVDQATATSILMEATERELRAGYQTSIRAQEIPLEWWDNPSVANKVITWTQNAELRVEARVDLLELLTRRLPDKAKSIAAEWSELAEDNSQVTQKLRWAGLNCRLLVDPAHAWPLVENAFRRVGPQVFAELSALMSDHRELRVDLSSWPAERLEALARMLLQTYPVSSDPDAAGRIVQMTAEHHLRRTRERAVEQLFELGTAEAVAALDRLAAADRGLAEQLRTYRARHAVREVLGELPGRQADEDSSSIPLAEAIKLLDWVNYRLVRSHDDLLEAVCDVLRIVENDVANDLPMLYGKPSRKKPSGKEPSRKKGVPRRRLEEDALQAYIRRRLTDLLPTVGSPGTELEFAL